MFLRKPTIMNLKLEDDMEEYNNIKSKIDLRKDKL